MNTNETNPATNIAIEQAARVITGGLLLAAASILLAALMIAERPGIGLSIIALLNAAMFYLLGLGSIRSAAKQRRIAAEQGPPPAPSVSKGA